MRRTIYAARYLSDPDYRRRISRQLNKGESIYALKHDLIYAHEGAFRARHLEAQTEPAWCLTLATNGVIAWTTEYTGLRSSRSTLYRALEPHLAQAPTTSRGHRHSAHRRALQHAAAQDLARQKRRMC